jgi:hypothetical protein
VQGTPSDPDSMLPVDGADGKAFAIQPLSMAHRRRSSSWATSQR